MKARLISVLLVIALLVTVGVITAQADNAATCDCASKVGVFSAAGIKLNGVCAAADAMTDVANATTCPYCGEISGWTELTAEGGELAGGHYYVNGTKSITTKYLIKTGNDVCIHLNKGTLTSKEAVFYVTGGSLNIMGTGTVTGSGNGADTVKGSAGGVLHTAGGTTRLMGGTYTSTTNKSNFVFRTGTAYIANGTTITRGTEADTGSNVLQYGGSTIVMYGGTISNGKATYGGNVYIHQALGNVVPTFTMYGGEIYGGTAIHGGNFAFQGYTEVANESRVNIVIAGGKIYDGTAENANGGANGGNIYAYFKMNNKLALQRACPHHEVEVYGGQAKTGGNIYLTQGKKSDGTYSATIYPWLRDVDIHDGTALLQGGNLAVGAMGVAVQLGNPDVADGIHATMYGGQAPIGGNIYVASGGQFALIKTGAVYGGVANQEDGAQGGSIWNAGTVTLGGIVGAYKNAQGEIVVSGGLAESNAEKKDALGGNIYNSGTVTINATATVYGGTARNVYTGNEESAKGGNIYSKGTLTVNGTISGGSKDENYPCYGGSLAVEGGTTTVNKNAVIEQGTATHGGCVYVEGGTFTLNGGTVQNGTATADGSCVYGRHGTIELKDGIVRSNVAGPKTAGQSTSTRQGSVVLGGTASGKPVLVLGSVEIETEANARIWEAIFYNSNSQIIISSAFDTSLYVRTNSTLPAYGAQFGNNGADKPLISASGEFSGTLAVPQRNYAPVLYTDADQAVMLPNVKVGDAWYTAQQAYNKTEIKEFQLLGDATLTVAPENDTKVDLNGKNITVSGTGAFNGINTTSAKAGKAYLLGEVTTDIPADPGFKISNWTNVTGKAGGFYDIAIAGVEKVEDEDVKTATYHKLEMAMTSISLRPNEAGLYYTSKVVADDTLKELISSAGILLGTIDSNERNEGTVKDNMAKIKGMNVEEATAHAQDNAFSIVAPNNKVWTDITSVIIRDILQENDADWNGTYGEWPVIGTPFVVIADMYLPAGQEETKAYSMQEYLGLAADAVAAGKITTQAEDLANFCNKYDVYNLGWGITPDSWILPAPAPAPEEE